MNKECYVCGKPIEQGYLCNTHAVELFEMYMNGIRLITNPKPVHHCNLCGECDDRVIVEYFTPGFYCDKDIFEELDRFYNNKAIVERFRSYSYQEPWSALNDNNGIFEVELKKEINNSHILYGREVVALAKREDCDDVLFGFYEGIPKFTVVHLTWKCGREDGNWPRTIIFNSWIEFKEFMKRNNEEYILE